MEKTGLLLKAADRANRDWESYHQKESTPEALSYQEGLNKTLELLQDVGKSNLPEVVLAVEKVFLLQEKETYANSSEMVNSIKPALADMDSAYAALELVSGDHQAYQKAATTYSGKHLSAGLPLDAFREFVKSHKARLTNRLRSVSSVPEKNILRQRKENLISANKCYITLQRHALGIEKEMERELSM
jgi:hypothetical protein